jgi:Tfp pilus assembly protein PilO
MEKLKQYVTFTVLGCIVVLAAGWFLLVSPKRATATSLRSQSASAVSENAQLQTKLQELKAQAKDLPRQQAKLATVAAKIPDNPALPALVRALTTAATSADVELVSVTPSAPTLVTAARVAAAPVTVPGAVPAAGVVKPAAVAPVSAGAGQLAAIPVVVTVVGGYFQAEQFVNALENLPRALRVTNIAVTPGANPVKPSSGESLDSGKSLQSVITGQVYMAANRPPATAVTVPGQAVTGTGAGPVAPVTPAKK